MTTLNARANQPAGPTNRGEAMPTGRERPGEHWNARIIREDREAACFQVSEHHLMDVCGQCGYRDPETAPLPGTLAPAGDGGLREALGRLAGKWEGMDTPALSMPSNKDWAEGVDSGYSQAAYDLRGTLADHPAAVPYLMPDREALRAHLLKAEVVRADGGYWDTPTPQEAERMADVVRALLAGEQEQARTE